MTGNLRAWRALLVVLLLAAAAVVLPAAAQSTAATEPLTWTLSPTPGETPEETLTEETPVGPVENETPEETPAGTGNNTTNETGPLVVVGTDEATPVDTATAELPTFTPIQAAQVNGSATQAAPLSIAGVILAALVAALVVVFGRNRK